MDNNFLIRLTLASFAVYRLSQLITIDNGPFFVFKQLRGWTKKLSVENDLFSSLAEGISCVYCTGIWMAVLCGIIAMWPTVAGDLFLITFSLAGVQTILQRYAA